MQFITCYKISGALQAVNVELTKHLVKTREVIKLFVASNAFLGRLFPGREFTRGEDGGWTCDQ